MSLVLLNNSGEPPLSILKPEVKTRLYQQNKQKLTRQLLASYPGTPNGGTWFHHAVLFASKGISLLEFMSMGLHLNAEDSDGNRVFHLACANGFEPLLKEMISNADEIGSLHEEVNALNCRAENPLYVALLNGRVSIVRELLRTNMYQFNENSEETLKIRQLLLQIKSTKVSSERTWRFGNAKLYGKLVDVFKEHRRENGRHSFKLSWLGIG
ncbi:ankyrin repeat domain-containing protein [Parashewanella hymeniacidonis]|uniref:ankyrin repeat domain-containing protein n=1 Tax=Parashewanella hymeniacidonis TaxID=2807618 RepID=UPI001EF3EAB3|nr:ankyrin repeat domain-containing protein [Parashewanella hymeniacidonis]